jgi:hypothetical protein
VGTGRGGTKLHASVAGSRVTAFLATAAPWEPYFTDHPRTIHILGLFQSRLGTEEYALSRVVQVATQVFLVTGMVVCLTTAKVKVMLRQTVSRSICQSVLVSGSHLGPATNFSPSFFNYF